MRLLILVGRRALLGRVGHYYGGAARTLGHRFVIVVVTRLEEHGFPFRGGEYGLHQVCPIQVVVQPEVKQGPII